MGFSCGGGVKYLFFNFYGAFMSCTGCSLLDCLLIIGIMVKIRLCISHFRSCLVYRYSISTCKFSSIITKSCPTSLANLNPFSSPLVVAAQYRPARSIRLGQSEFQLGTQHAELRLFGVNWRKQRVCILEPLVVRSREVEVDRGGGEVDFGVGLVDFLEVKRDVHRCWGLIKVISVRRVTGQSENSQYGHRNRNR